jgi:hypothetical protein
LVALKEERGDVLMARETWDSRMGAKVKASQLSAISDRVLVCPLAAVLTARSFLTVMPWPLTGLADSKMVVAAGGDMISSRRAFVCSSYVKFYNTLGVSNRGTGRKGMA